MLAAILAANTLACREAAPAAKPALSGATRTASVASAELRRHVVYLADPRLDGRGADARGLEVALDYVERELKTAGLAPGVGQSARRRFAAPGSTRLGDVSVLDQRGGRGFRVGRDFVPFAFSSTGAWTGPLAFGARGLVLTPTGVDDYRGLDVRGRALVLLEALGDLDAEHAGRLPSIYARIREAERRGASAVLVVRDRLSLPPVQPHAPTLSILALQVTRGSAERLLGIGRGASLTHTPPRVFDRPPARVVVSLVRDAATLEHVVMVTPGSGDAHVWLTANLEHVGLGGWSSRSGSDRRQTHPGACESAAGVALLLGVARELAAAPARPGVAFGFLSGETGQSFGRAALRRQLGAPRLWIDVSAIGCIRDRRVYRSARATPLDGPLTRALARSGLTLETQPLTLPWSVADFLAGEAGDTLQLSSGPEPEALRPGDTADRVSYGAVSELAGAMADALRELPIEP